MSRERGAVRQHAIFGDFSNDKQWCDHLYNPSSHDTTCPVVGESTNLSLGEDECDGTRSVTSVTRRPDKHQRAHGVERTRLDEYCDGGLVQPMDSTWSLRGSGRASAVQAELEDDHEGEEDVECNRNLEVYKTETVRERGFDGIRCMPG